MQGYYTGKLNGRRLQQCYDIASDRVKQYLEAEIHFLIQHLEPKDEVLELGCGYGRVTHRLAETSAHVTGIDSAAESIDLARELYPDYVTCKYEVMDALELTFPDSSFDKVVCVQNGICAFAVDRLQLINEALRVTRAGGKVYFSTYSPKFWSHRLKWFQNQAAAGLLGEIDSVRTGGGVIVCNDGFSSGYVSEEEFRSLAEKAGVDCRITEVDESSVFCEMTAPDIN